MLDRYQSPAMRELWSPAYQFQCWHDIEVVAAHVAGAPKHVVDELRNSPVPTPQQVTNQETLTRHDVAAFVYCMGRSLGDEAGSWLHRYLTSSDVVDTANGMRLLATSRIIEARLTELQFVVTEFALRNRLTYRMGRTHGQPAEDSSLGYRFAEIAFMLDRCATVLDRGRIYACVGRYAGPVGNYRYTSQEMEEKFCHQLNVYSAGSGTQVVSRDRYTDWIFALSRIASVVEQIALEIRLSNLDGIDELSEPSRDEWAVGSSSMPHKTNPVLSEGLTGLSRMVRSLLAPTMESVPLWFERDISHSSVERFTLSTAAGLTEAMIIRATRLIEGLRVDEEEMVRKIIDVDLVSAWKRIQLQEAGYPYAKAWDMVNATPDSLPIPLRSQPLPKTGHVFEQVSRLNREARNFIHREDI